MGTCGCVSVSSLLSADLHPYLHSVAEVSPSSHSHHGQQACACSNVQDNDLLATGLHSGHSCSDALIVFFILTKKIKFRYEHTHIYVHRHTQVDQFSLIHTTRSAFKFAQ